MEFHVAREGQELGGLDAAQVAGLLEVKFLRPTDEFWTEADAQPRPLAEWAAPTKSRPGWLARAQQGAGAVGSMIRERSVRVAGGVRSLSRESRDAMTAAANRAMEDYLPQLRDRMQVAIQKSSQTLGASLHDEAFLRKAFGAAYDCLPRPICRFVNEEQFIGFCLKHRERLLPSKPAPPAVES